MHSWCLEIAPFSCGIRVVAFISMLEIERRDTGRCLFVWDVLPITDMLTYLIIFTICLHPALVAFCIAKDFEFAQSHRSLRRQIYRVLRRVLYITVLKDTFAIMRAITVITVAS